VRNDGKAVSANRPYETVKIGLKQGFLQKIKKKRCLNKNYFKKAEQRFPQHVVHAWHYPCSAVANCLVL
jgi:hypothetical protein